MGTDNVDLAAAAERGVAVANTPGVLDDAVADLCVGLALAAARRIAEGDRLVRSGGWTGFSTDLLLGLDLAGATAGLVGLGGVGRAVARRLVAGFGMRGLYVARHPHPEDERALGVERAGLDDLLRAADLVTVHVPLTDETRGMIGDRELALMRPGAVLVNVSRGPVVDGARPGGRAARGAHRRRARRLRRGADSGRPPLRRPAERVLTPHIASAGRRTRDAMAALAVDNLLAMAAGERPPAPVVWQRPGEE